MSWIFGYQQCFGSQALGGKRAGTPWLPSSGLWGFGAVSVSLGRATAMEFHFSNLMNRFDCFSCLTMASGIKVGDWSDVAHPDTFRHPCCGRAGVVPVPLHQRFQTSVKKNLEKWGTVARLAVAACWEEPAWPDVSELLLPLFLLILHLAAYTGTSFSERGCPLMC